MSEPQMLESGLQPILALGESEDQPTWSEEVACCQTSTCPLASECKHKPAQEMQSYAACDSCQKSTLNDT